MTSVEDRLRDRHTILTPRVVRNLVRLGWAALMVFILVRGMSDLHARELQGETQLADEVVLLYTLVLVYLNSPAAFLVLVLLQLAAAQLPPSAAPVQHAVSTGLHARWFVLIFSWLVFTGCGYVQWFVLVPRLGRWIQRKWREADRCRSWS